MKAPRAIEQEERENQHVQPTSAEVLLRACMLSMPLEGFGEALKSGAGTGGAAVLATLGVLSVLIPSCYRRPGLHILSMAALVHWTWSSGGDHGVLDHIGYGFAAWMGVAFLRHFVKGLVELFKVANLVE